MKSSRILWSRGRHLAGAVFIGALGTLLGASAGFSQEGSITPDRPGIGTGTAVLEPGALLLETGFQASFDDGAALDFGQLLLRYGFGAAELQLFLNSFAVLSPDGRSSSTGVRDVSLGSKISLSQGGNHRVSILPVVVIPIGSAGIGGDDWVPAVTLIADRSLTTRASITANAGVSIASGDAPTAWTLILTPAWAVGERATVYSGYGGSYSDGGPSHFLEGGVAFLSTPRRQLDLNAGVDVRTGATFLGFGVAIGLR